VLDRASADNLAVAEAMTRVVFAVQPDDPLISAIRLMVEERIHRVLVTDEHGKLAGIVVPMDILRELSRRSAEHAENVGFKYVDLRQ
jgi:CBS domain-containing protein